jgi:mannose-1-phosphate guanylyltransferase
MSHHRILASEQLREVGVELCCALLEPVSRGASPAQRLAALAAMEGGTDPVVYLDEDGIVRFENSYGRKDY